MLNNAALRWMNDLSAQGIFMTDAQLTIRAWNQWLEVRSGRTAAEMNGRNLLEAYPDLVERGLDRYYGDALAGQIRVLSQRLHHYLLPMPPQDDDSPFTLMQQSSRIAPLVDKDRVIGTITVIDDVTERITSEDQLVRLLGREQAARKEAETANRTKDEFLAIVSHELRTPLNAISGWVQILRQKTAESEFLAHGLEVVERNVKMQTKIIEDILDMSRIITGKLSLTVTRVDLPPVIEAALDAVRITAEAKEIRLEWAFDPDVGQVSGDPGRLEQVVLNLLSNAIKFSPRGGVVRVRLARDESHAEITVSDKGKGISKEFLPFVFERFRQADNTSTRQQSGLGLGLAIVHHLVEMHGGTVSAASEGEGKGATFTLRLPVVEGDDEGEPQVRSEGELPVNGAAPSPANGGDLSGEQDSKFKGVRVLIVDDDADARDMLGVVLSRFGAEVRKAASVQQALKILEDWRPHALVSDVGMPHEDGYSLIRKVRELEPEHGGLTPAIALTGYGRPEDRSQLLSAGYKVHMSKPVELIQLVDTIANLVGRDV
ncbi:MAG TPA: ATP-binding protein [Blastocatellia bacterium]|nr:ATP-binding protein [Blastocatellia bacterium]